LWCKISGIWHYTNVSFCQKYTFLNCVCVWVWGGGVVSLDPRTSYLLTIQPKENYSNYFHSYNSDPSSSDSEEDCDSDSDTEEEAYDYISLFQVWMNFLFPRAFRSQPVHRWIKSAHSVSNLRERSTGKILSPVGRCSLFPQGVFVQSTTEKDVTKICFPGAQETFKAPSRSSRNHKQPI